MAYNENTGFPMLLKEDDETVRLIMANYMNRISLV